MILFCDENIGTSVPSSLRSVGLPTLWAHKLGWLGKTDVDFLTIVGRKGWLVLSCNKKMLMVPEERKVLIESKIGVVFMTTGWTNPPTLLRLLLTNWPKLEEIDSLPRPFARFLSPNGRITSSFRNFSFSAARGVHHRGNHRK